MFSHVTKNLGGELVHLFNVVGLIRRLSICIPLSGSLALSITENPKVPSHSEHRLMSSVILNGL